MSTNKIHENVVKRIEASYEKWKEDKFFNPKLEKSFKQIWIESAMQEALISTDNLVTALKMIAHSDPVGVGLDEMTRLAETALEAYAEGYVVDQLEFKKNFNEVNKGVVAIASHTED